MWSYWLWFLFHAIVWVFAFIFFDGNTGNMVFRLVGVALYFAIFFLLPLTHRAPNIGALLLSINALLAMLTLFPGEAGEFNPYLILILSLVIGEGFYRLAFKLSMMTGIIGAIGLMIPVIYADLLLIVKIFAALYIIILLIAMIFYKKTKNHNDDLEARYGALLSEYRDLKRRVVSEEEITRQEERMLIAHEIHDSVGHKLTALVMQLEAFRIKTAEKDKEQVQFLKELASESLEETRSAVKSLKTNETGGLPGIMRLIRKLEMESVLHVHFSVKHGAFSAALTGEQSFVIYRSVQEALTNIMKHSNAREVEIMFEAPGGSIFRFEISNPITDNRRYLEGFGLTSMRERLEKFGGDLDVYKTEGQFIVSGFLKIGYGGLE